MRRITALVTAIAAVFAANANVAVAQQKAEKLWLTGDILGWRGPWGTTYAANLRLVAASMTQGQFVKRATSPELRPPMPWFNVRDMTPRDVKAIYAYLKYLGPAGEPAPAYVRPDQMPTGPFVQFPPPPADK